MVDATYRSTNVAGLRLDAGSGDPEGPVVGAALDRSCKPLLRRAEIAGLLVHERDLRVGRCRPRLDPSRSLPPGDRSRLVTCTYCALALLKPYVGEQREALDAERDRRCDTDEGQHRARSRGR